MITGYYEDLSVGQEFETGGRTITESYVLQFAMLSGDWHPLHTDAEYARATPAATFLHSHAYWLQMSLSGTTSR